MADVFASTYGVELLCTATPVIAKAELLANLQRRCPGARPLDPNPGSPLLAFVHPEHLVKLTDAAIPAQTMVAVADKPLDHAHLEAALQQTWEFEGARAVVVPCTSSVLVTDILSSPLEYRERLVLFEATLRAVLETVSCAAICWTRSGRIVDPAVWTEAFDSGDPAQCFFAGAVNVRLFNVQNGEKGELIMDTLGLGALGLDDLQCQFRSLDPGAVARVLYNTAWYVFSGGRPIADGETVQGAAAGSKWRCQRGTR